ncbi:MAG: flagellar basal-body rod protein FlgF [Gammaproteobacteria bacterium]|jgi:flagellar basal-body rod protein FlgF|nr:flagellar basal-body rod protein FlgF [Gammaproteobacteria bacterium]MBP6052748.1 flagellar basal-body rod protein FlgF [Pseudomonadales bacterium]MBK6584087.1 flagellar basal-body rod protein FlgF [Gammaproteobacteria bacterium]MBK7168656.1 flagellar basal-body rod protein FlgF [Gammaproteobacteria bacterium]MBK7520277.1 flagellar basal-body rod protein FlgF [Gammaproteobacteria bacterium]
MDKALYTSMTGAKHNTIAQTVHANNLANVSTDGFRRDYVTARSMGIYYGDGFPTRAHALAERPATDFEVGTLRETGRDLDIAVSGEGWIAVQAPDGKEAYTRAGNLQITPLGQLLTGNGLPVRGNGGPIAIPDSSKIEIGGDGTITVRALGQGPESLSEINRIRLVNPPERDLVKREDGLVYYRNGERAPVDAQVSVVSGFLEGSNVNAVEALTEMLSLARQYEMQVKLMKTVDEDSEAAARLLQVA